MTVTHVFGIDPGLVHTGVVHLRFASGLRRVNVTSVPVAGPDAAKVADWIRRSRQGSGLPRAHVFIEGYKPRSHFGTDASMVKAVHDMHQAIPGSIVLLNTGVKKVVRRPLMELVGVWNFAVTTNHQDLRSAARIALLGMLKDPELNTLLADLVRDHLAGEPWLIHT